VAVAVCGGILWYRSSYPTYSFLYRITANVEVDGKVRAGTSVVGIVWKKQPQFPISVPEILVRPYGQAVFVDIGRHGVLLIPLSSYPYFKGTALDDLPFRALGRRRSGSDEVIPATPREMCAFLSQEHVVATVDADLLQFIWMKNADDPDSAQILWPQQFSEKFAGKVHLKNVVVEMWHEEHDAHVSTGIQNRLPWLSTMRAEQKAGGVTSERPGEFSWNSFTIWRERDD